RTVIRTPAGSRGPKRALTDRVENSKPAGVRAGRSTFKAAKSHAAWLLSPRLSRPLWLILRPPACNPTRSSGDSAKVASESENPSSDKGRDFIQEVACKAGKISRTENWG